MAITNRLYDIVANGVKTNVAVISIGHLVAAVTIMVGKSGYGGRPRGLLGTLADHHTWALIHIFASIVLVLAAKARHLTMAASASASVMGLWSVLMLWWAASLEPDATWLAGLLGLLLAAHSVIVADKSARLDED